MRLIGYLLFGIAGAIMSTNGLDFLSMIGIVCCCVIGCALIDWSDENET